MKVDRVFGFPDAARASGVVVRASGVVARASDVAAVGFCEGVSRFLGNSGY